jgi:hypothetical protein
LIHNNIKTFACRCMKFWAVALKKLK